MIDQTFLDAINHGMTREDGWRILFMAKDKKPCGTSPAFLAGDPGIHEAVEHFEADYDVYYGVGALREKPAKGRGKAKDVETINFLWVDIDVQGGNHNKNNLPPTIDDACDLLESTGLSPGLIVSTGGGIHAYVLLDKPYRINGSETRREFIATLAKRYQERIQQAAKANGWTVDSTHDLSRVLRIPGTRNHKQQPPYPVELFSASEARYTIEEIRDRLEDRQKMLIDYSDDTLRILGALDKLSAERCSDYHCWLIVGMTLHDAGFEWTVWDNWSKQAPNYQKGVCEAKWRTFGRNGSDKVSVNTLFQWAKEDSGEPVPPSNGKLGQTSRDPKTKQDDPAYNPLQIARDFVTAHYSTNGFRTLTWYKDDWYAYTGTHYEVVERKLIEHQLWKYMESIRQCRNSKVSEVYNALSGCAAIPSNKQMEPFWIADEDQAPVKAEDIISLRNGLLTASDRRWSCHTPNLFNLNCLPFDYDIEADPPEEWLKFLDSLWGEDYEQIYLLQEWFGYCLTQDTSQQKILLMIGPTRSGKGTISQILENLVGRDNVASPTFASLSQDFGLEQLIGKQVAIIPDARLDSHTSTSIICERLLSISGEDRIVINRKYKTVQSFRLKSKIMINTNVLPNLTDSSTALAYRFVILSMQHSFLWREDLGLKNRLLKELPGIFLWALDGLERLRDNQKFTTPASSLENVATMLEISSPIKSFVEECCNLHPGAECYITDLYNAYRDWCDSSGRQSSSVQIFSRNLRSLYPEINKTKHFRQRRSFVGISVK